MSESIKTEGVQEDRVSLPKALVQKMRTFSQFNFEAIYGNSIKKALQASSLPVSFAQSPREFYSALGKILYGQTGENYPSSDEYHSNEYFGEDGWLKCPPASLRGHIVSAHLQARTLVSYGVARYDIEVAHYRDMSLEWVCKKIYECLERTDQDIWNEIREHQCSEFTPHDYRIVLIKNLLFIERLQCAQIDWDRVERSFPEYQAISLNLSTDSHDASFYKTTLKYYEGKIMGTLQETSEVPIDSESGAFLPRYTLSKK